MAIVDIRQLCSANVNYTNTDQKRDDSWFICCRSLLKLWIGILGLNINGAYLSYLRFVDLRLFAETPDDPQKNVGS